jgi:transcription initiation factor TFIID subunit 1
MELKRLERNKERREARERDKGKRTTSFIGDAMPPESAPAPGSPMVSTAVSTAISAAPAGKATTARKCKNCGLVGHIRTNKKVCPKLNGQWAEMGMSPPDGNTPMAAAGGTPGP